MKTTDYHAKYFAHELTKRCPSNSLEGLSATLSNAQVDLNPHQIDAALFVLQSPLSKGAILADEVGLGKTIEAGLVISQKWAERKRKILIVVPASLKIQWEVELREKFFLQAQILETPLFNKSVKEGNPFAQENTIIICSYHFASAKASYMKKIKWDLVIIDEAHRLRNVWKTNNKMAKKLRDALGNTPKLLLTATPLQNNLRELFGLVSMADQNIFGDLKTFEKKYLKDDIFSGPDSREELEKQKAELEEGIKSSTKRLKSWSNSKNELKCWYKEFLFISCDVREYKYGTSLRGLHITAMEMRHSNSLKDETAQKNDEYRKRLGIFLDKENKKKYEDEPRREIAKMETKLEDVKKKLELAESTGNVAKPEEFEDLRQRLKTVCKRTLRSNVPNIKFTERKCHTQDFELSKSEKQLYDGLTSYLQRDNLFAYARGTRGLVRMILRKLLASSSFAIAGTLRKTVKRLDGLKNLEKHRLSDEIPPEILDDYEGLGELREESDEEDDIEESGDEGERGNTIPNELTMPRTSEPPENDERELKKELEELKRLCSLAEGIKRNTKADALPKALKIGFEKASTLGAKRKAVIFTESRVTQSYLEKFLSENGYAGKIVLLNGSYGSEDRKKAVECFRAEAEVMIGTEAAAEGLNLQFCSLVVNYDLPWNPQRIEQRIGRCHRYGQKHDVVVINFLNRANVADRRVYELLDQKLKLFDGVFGASDEILGVIGNGVDIERRIQEIYQDCRTEEDTNSKFSKIEEDLAKEISACNKNAEKMLFSHFDQEVRASLIKIGEEGQSYHMAGAEWLWKITRHYFGENAKYEEHDKAFVVIRDPYFTKVASVGRRYKIGGKTAGTSVYRPAHPLAQEILEAVKTKETGDAEVTFDYSSHHEGKISVLQQFVGKSGVLKLSRLTVKALEEEDALIVSALDDTGFRLDPEIAKKFFALYGSQKNSKITGEERDDLKTREDGLVGEYLRVVEDRNKKFYISEVEKLGKWSDDKEAALKDYLKKLEDDLDSLQNKYKKTDNIDEKVTLERDIALKKKELNKKRVNLWGQHGKEARKREKEIEKIKAELKCKHSVEHLFTIRWKII
ncbi:MAG: DEAD/DEAH box helicase family protein [Nitrospinae bacterium]|nr:DEAD/DEAH box helicase family protein [Nitrospinota bacterium]